MFRSNPITYDTILAIVVFILETILCLLLLYCCCSISHTHVTHTHTRTNTKIHTTTHFTHYVARAGLNTCIGSANYAWFYRTLQSLCAMQVVHLAVQLYLVIDLLLRDGPTRQRVESRGILHGANDDDDQAATTATATVLFVFVAFNMASLALIGQLIQFHRVLQRENLTTYEFVVRDHKEKRAQARLAGDLEAQRVVLVKKAEREGRTGLALKLRVGGACRQTTGAECCDPLNLPDPPPEPDPEAGFASVLGDGVSGGGVAATDNDDDGIGFGGVGSYANGDGAHAANSYSYADADDDEVNDYSNNNSSTNELLLLPPTSSHSRRSMRSSNETTVAEEQEPPAAAAAAPAGEQQQLVDLMHEVGLQQEQTLQTNTQTTSGMSDTASSCAVQEDLDIMYDNNCGVDNSNYSNFSHDDSVEVDTHDNIITGSLRNTDIQLLPPLETNNSLLNDLSDDQLLMAEGDEDDDGDADGDETFENEPDDVSYTSGCSGRSSNRSGRSARSINKATAAAAMGERDYTAF